MLYELLKYYFDENNLPWYSPLDIDVLIAGDYHLYLYDGGGSLGWFVVVEADALPVLSVPRDIESSFPVEVEGWYTLLDYQKKSGSNILPPHIFKSERINESDDDWEYYQSVVHQDVLKYAVLKVRPKHNVGVEDFRLTYYGDGDASEVGKGL